MAAYPVVYGGVKWPTTEHLFQAMRLPPNHTTIAEMLKSANPMTAKLLAKASAPAFIVEPMSALDLDNMRLCLRLKLDAHPALRDLLGSSGERRIIEDVTARRGKGSAMFWGAALEPDGTWSGENWLGRLWMELRDAQKV